MNKYINKIFLTSVITLAGMLGATSCTDYLDKSPYSDIEENDPYKNFKNFQGFTEELYNCIPVVSNSEYHTSFNFGEEDYWEPQELRLFARNIDYGDFWGWTTCYYSYPSSIRGGKANSQERSDKGNLWKLCWYGIRKANIGIANLGNLVSATEEERNLIEGQLYFFRGWFHFMLMEWWGGMPYVDQVLPPDVAPALSRLTWQECAEKCVADFDHADITFGKDAAIRCDLLRIVPLSKTEAGADDQNNIPPNKQPIDPRIWYENSGRTILEALVADLNSRGHSKLTLRENGDICIQQGEELVPQEHLSNFPAKVYWPRLVEVFESNGLSAETTAQGIQVSW